jgi:hypothetical protein
MRARGRQAEVRRWRVAWARFSSLQASQSVTWRRRAWRMASTHRT